MLIPLGETDVILHTNVSHCFHFFHQHKIGSLCLLLLPHCKNLLASFNFFFFFSRILSYHWKIPIIKMGVG
uniref:Uncharacterized protein n=1 Tax=Rhizophora mucronata TaxID=61149 RepID=A0A2P2PPI6_RHIMU